jgi:ATP-dependent exoDNAse (exonuclease V) alpha subunit
MQRRSTTAFLHPCTPPWVLMNLPFSVAPHVDRRMADAALRHVTSTLARLCEGGRLVAITGASLSPDTSTWRDAFDYDREVCNGDLGIVQRIDQEEGELAVAFDGREVSYSFGERDEVVLAYATTTVVLVGQRKALAIAVRNQGARRRWSKLREHLTGAGTDVRD